MFIDSSAFIEIMTAGDGHEDLLKQLAASTIRPITAHHVRGDTVRELCKIRCIQTGKSVPDHRDITVSNELYDRALQLLQCTKRPATKEGMIAAGYFSCDFPHLTHQQALTAACVMMSRRKLVTTSPSLKVMKFSHVTP